MRNHAGFHPTPHKGHCPLTQYRKWQFSTHEQCPGETEKHAHVHLQRKIVTFRIGCGTAAHAETPSLIRMVALRAGCGTAATQKPLCRGRLFLCELDAPLAPRRNPFAKERMKLCELGVAQPPTGWAVEHRRPDALHPGKMRKNRQESSLS